MASALDATPLLLLFIAISANFLGQSLPCSTQRMLQRPWAKIALIYTLFFFTIVYTNPDNSFVQSAKSSLVPFFLFLLCTVAETPYVMVALFLLVCAHVLKMELKGNRIKNRARAEQIVEACNALAVLSILAGVAMYYRRQRRAHARHWSWNTFFSLKCRKH